MRPSARKARGLKADERTIAEYLKPAGYATAVRAEVLTGLKTAYEHFESGTKAAFRRCCSAVRKRLIRDADGDGVHLAGPFPVRLVEAVPRSKRTPSRCNGGGPELAR